MVMHDGSVLHCNIHIWDAVLTEYWPAIVVWSRIELPDTSAHDSGSIDSVESDWERAIDFTLKRGTIMSQLLTQLASRCIS